MPTDTVATGATTSTADAATAASKGATDDAATKAAADKAAADKAAADKAAADQTAAAKAAADAAAAKAAELAKTYELKLPDGSKLDPSILERTTAIASALGLDKQGAEKLLATRVQEHTDAATAFEAAWKAPDEKGQGAGPAWIAREEGFRKEAYADKSLSPNGTEAGFAPTLELAQRGLAAVDKSGELGKLLKTTGYGSHPAVLKILAHIGKEGAEGTQIHGAGFGGKGKATEAQKMFPNMYNEDGSPKS